MITVIVASAFLLLVFFSVHLVEYIDKKREEKKGKG